MATGRRMPEHDNWVVRLATGATFALAILVGIGAFLIMFSGLQNVGPTGVIGASGTATPTVAAAETPTEVETPVVQAEVIPPTPTPGFTFRISAGQRINLRASPSTSADVVTLLAPGTLVMIVGPDKEAEGKTWRNIKDEQGNTGWTWSDFVVPVVAP